MPAEKAGLARRLGMDDRGSIAGRPVRARGVEDGLFMKSWRAGDDRLRTNHVQADDGAEERVRSVEAQTSSEQASDTQAASGLLMCLAAGLFVASAVISLTLLWFATRGIQWLLFR
jgi:hypothetical protein